MEILPGIEVVDLSLHLPASKTLIFADFHIGFEESLESQGILVPRFQLKDILARLEKIFEQIDSHFAVSKADRFSSSPLKVGEGENRLKGAERREQAPIKTIVINGDLKHEFGEISRQEWSDCLALIDFLAARCEQIVLVKGNHDTILGPIARKRNLEVVDSYTVNDIFIAHGHKLPEKELAKTIKTIIIGHEHPAVNLTEAAKTEKYKCFLKGSWHGRNLIVQPSFNLITEGADVAKQKLLSPFLQRGVENFEIFVVDDKKNELLYFGKIKEL